MNSTAVNAGQHVNAGDVIGYMGQTGNATGVHLHFAIATNDTGGGGRINNNPGQINYSSTYNNPPRCAFDTAVGITGGIKVTGWAFDPDEPTKMIDVHFYAKDAAGNLTAIGATTANKYRADVDNAWHCGAYHGYEDTLYTNISGTYTIQAAALDTVYGGTPTWKEIANVTIGKDSTPPVISNVQVTDISYSGYTVSCDVSDNIGIDRVAFPTWSVPNDQDDIFKDWANTALGTISGNHVTYRVNTSDHNNETGCYYSTHIYAYDKAGNYTSVSKATGVSVLSVWVPSMFEVPVVPTVKPTLKPTEVPVVIPTEAPTAKPTAAPTVKPTSAPTAVPTAKPTAAPTSAPTAAPTARPTAAPTSAPTAAPTVGPTATVTPIPTSAPTPKPAKIKITKCKFTVKNVTYTGKAVTAKAMKAAVTVKYGGKTLKAGTDYTLSYDKKLKAIGTATATVKGKGNYTGSKKVTFRINPKGTAFSKLTGGKQQITLKWKNPKNITGYEIQYSLKKNLSGKKTVKIKKAKTLATTIKKLAANKTYYVRIRTYTTVKKKNYYSAWSKIKAVKTKTGKASNAPDGQNVEAATEENEMTYTLDEELDGEILSDEIFTLLEELPQEDTPLTLAE